jgi:localization factor PodJL
LYDRAASLGNRKAMYNLALAYVRGSGVSKSPTEAVRWFLKAADLGLMDAQFDLAVLYERGAGAPQSLLDAYRWYAIAAKGGDKESQKRVQTLATQMPAGDKAAAQKSADEFKASAVIPEVNNPPSMP